MNSSNIYLYTIKLAMRYINRYQSYWFWFFLRLVYVGTTLAVPILLGRIIDILSRGNFNYADLYKLAGIYCTLIFIGPALETGTVFKVLGIVSKVGRDFRMDAVRLIEHAPIDFFKEKNRGAILKIIDSAHAAIYRLSEDIIHRYLTSVGSIVGIFLSSIIFKPWVVIIFLVTAALSLSNLVVFGRREKTARIILSRAEESLIGGFSEFLVNFKTIFYLNLFKRQEADLSERIRESYNRRLELITCSMRKWYNSNQLQRVTMILIFLLCLYNVIQGNLSIGELTIILAFSYSLSEQMATLLEYSEIYIEQTSGIQRYRDELVTPLADCEHKKSTLLKNAFNILTVKGLGVTRQKRGSLYNVNFEIVAGDKVAIVGHTGSGKSTLLDVILKAITDYQGTVTINGIDYKHLTGQDIANIFSIVPQDVQLFLGTVRDNIASSKRLPSDTELDELLDICGLTSFVTGLPNGTDELIFESAANISGGERQRIGIARALFQNHPFLILDEATACLDPKTEREVMKKIIETYPNLTLLYVTHKYALLDWFENIYVMYDGQIIEQGTFQHLKDNGSLFRELFAASRISN